MRSVRDWKGQARSDSLEGHPSLLARKCFVTALFDDPRPSRSDSSQLRSFTVTENEMPKNLNRRELLAAGLTTLGAMAVGRGVRAEAPSASFIAPYGNFKMGLQSYSLRGLTTGGKADFDKALKAVHDLGLHYIESYTAHIPILDDAAKIAVYTDKAKANGVSVIGYGVLRFTKDHDANRKIFEFGKLLGLGYISADPDLDSFDSRDKLVEEYKIPIGIHNHGPGHKYGKIAEISAAIKDHSPLIGCCVDTGHFLRSKEDPVKAVETFGKRTYGVHLKDVKNATEFTVLGKGDLKTAALFKALAEINYDKCLAVEYEEHPDDPFAEIKACLDEAQRALKRVGTL